MTGAEAKKIIDECEAKKGAAPVGAIPAWLIGILQVVGPVVLQALQAWIAQYLKTNPPPTPEA